jgi:hypothetical protein
VKHCERRAIARRLLLTQNPSDIEVNRIRMPRFLPMKRSGLLSLGLIFGSIGQAVDQVTGALPH